MLWEDAQNRARLAALDFPEHKALDGERVVDALGPSPQFFNPPRRNYVLGWFYARRRVHFNTTDESSYGNLV